MAFSMGTQKKRGSRRKANISADINVTPLVDVMLVNSLYLSLVLLQLRARIRKRVFILKEIKESHMDE
jgi:biopolymer transport protein ExbD